MLVHFQSSNDPFKAEGINMLETGRVYNMADKISKSRNKDGEPVIKQLYNLKEENSALSLSTMKINFKMW